MVRVQLNLALSEAEDRKLRQAYKKYVASTRGTDFLQYNQWAKARLLK